MELAFSEELPLSSDAFGVAIFQDILFVPKELQAPCGRDDMKEVEELLTAMDERPGSFCKALKWSPKRYERARADLNCVLQGRVSDTFLYPAPFAPPCERLPSSVPLVEFKYIISLEDLDE